MKVTVTVDIADVKTKKCSGPCGQTLSLDAFSKDNRSKLKRKSYCRACDRLYKQQHPHARDPRYSMLQGAQRRARRKGLPFALTIDDIVIPAICPVLGIPLQRAAKRPRYNSPSLDQIAPGRGYVQGNIEVMSNRANMLKSNATIAELEAVLAHMKQHKQAEPQDAD
jgi:hypothetical protein